MSGIDKKPSLFVTKGAEETTFFSGAEKSDAYDLLYSAMFQETVRLRYCLSLKKKKASQEFILECFRELTAVQGKEHQGSSESATLFARAEQDSA